MDILCELHLPWFFSTSSLAKRRKLRDVSNKVEEKKKWADRCLARGKIPSITHFYLKGRDCI